MALIELQHPPQRKSRRFTLPLGSPHAGVSPLVAAEGPR
jgi:hypothetical protein